LKNILGKPPNKIEGFPGEDMKINQMCVYTEDEICSVSVPPFCLVTPLQRGFERECRSVISVVAFHHVSKTPVAKVVILVFLFILGPIGVNSLCL
jgi:hypothetical protein